MSAMPVLLMYSTLLKFSRIAGVPRRSASPYAWFRASSLNESISPRRSTIAVAATWRTLASRIFVAMAFSSQVHHQLDRMSHVVRADVHLVYHFFDQEKSPAARGLQA